jgi:hypothetical protein
VTISWLFTTAPAVPGLQEPQRLGARAHHQIAAHQRVAFARGDPDRADVLGAFGQTAMDPDRAALLGKPRHLHHARALAVHMGRHGEDRADGHDARAAHAGHDDVVRAPDDRQHRLGQVADIHGSRRGLADPAPLDRHEGGAEALHAGIVLVAGRLVDGALAAQFRLDRHDGDAVRLHAAIAAALADVGVDEHALVRVGELSALPPPPLLGRAGLDVDDGRHTLDVSEFPLHLGQFCPFVHVGPAREGVRVHVFLLVVDHGDMAHAHRLQFAHDLGRLEVAVVVLAARHGDGVVEEDLVGDVHARRERRPDRLNP